MVLFCLGKINKRKTKINLHHTYLNVITTQIPLLAVMMFILTEELTQKLPHIKINADTYTFNKNIVIINARSKVRFYYSFLNCIL